MIFKLWRAMQRRIDLQLLWPTVRDESIRMGHDMHKAHGAFYFHVMNDTAWTKDYADDELRAFISQLQ